ncbi:MAG: galactose mutarotase [Bacteroidales bacterium]|nr:galactose mutarotase [Bacteroidales bacterium]
MMKVDSKVVARLGGKDVLQFILDLEDGMMVKLLSYGAIVTHLTAPDRNGKSEDMVLGFDDPSRYWSEPYLSHMCYLGAIIGRNGNRIARGRFILNAKEYRLALNHGPDHIHGGIIGFDKVVWDSETIEYKDAIGVRFSYFSRDGEEGYPGNLRITVSFVLKKDHSLTIDYRGTIDQPCPVNLTHHGYWNLTGGVKRDILGHELEIYANRYTVTDAALIPTGEFRPLKGTPLDFNSPHVIGERIDRVPGGYDHNYVLSEGVTGLRKIARVTEPASGRVMEVLTTEPGVQFYTGNFLDGALTGKGGVSYSKHLGFCLETQHFPDSPNHPEFPDTVLQPGQTYRHTTVYRFRTVK